MHLFFPAARNQPRPLRRNPASVARLRAIFGRGALASILLVAVGCDKHGESAEVVHHTNLAGKPTVIYLLFGDRADPRLLPVATTIEGQVAPIALSAQGWKDFDRIYLRSGTKVSL